MVQSSLARPATEAPSFVALLRQRAVDQPDRTILTHLLDDARAGGSLTYGELDRRARAIAVGLLERARPGDRCLLLHPQGLDWIAAFYGCLYAGVIAVPAFPPGSRRLGARIHGIVADASPRLALATTAVVAHAARRAAVEPQPGALEWLATDDVPDEAADLWREPSVGPESLALLQYTSGSTSTPSGVMVSHANLLHNARAIERSLGLSGATVSVTWMPFFHDAGLFSGVLQPVFTGLPTHVMAPVAFLTDPLGWLRAVSRYGAQTSGGPNFAFDLCARLATPESVQALDLSRWSVAINGAEPVRAETLRRFAEVFAPAGFRAGAFVPSFGLAEATLMVSGGGPTPRPVIRAVDAAALREHRVELVADEAPGRLEMVGCGRVIDGTTVVIVDPETRRAVAPGVVGEIWVGGPTVTQGYWGRQAESEATFRACLATDDSPADLDGGPVDDVLPGGGASSSAPTYLRTGDLGFLNGGELFVTGRLKDLLIIRGRNHYPQDVEHTVETSHPTLRPHAGAAFTIDLDGEERLVVLQELKLEHQKADVESVAGQIRRAVAEEHELQVHVVGLLSFGAIPMTSSGKIRRRACRDGYLDGSLKPIGLSVLDATETDRPARDEDTTTASLDQESGPLSREHLLAAQAADRRALIERDLRRLVAGALRTRPAVVSTQRPLLELGLDSLTGVRLAATVERALGVALPPTAFLDDPTIGSIAEAILAQISSPSGETGVGDGHPRPLDPVACAPSQGGSVRLTHGQRALWLLHQFDPNGAAYNLAGAVRVSGPLDLDALRRTFEALAERHAAFRTTIEVRAGEPVGVVHGRLTPDWRMETEPRDPGELARRLAEVAWRPYDLAQGPLLRVSVFPTGADAYVVLVGTHHIAADLWSLGVLAREVGEAYAALAAGQEWSPPPPPPSLPDVAARERAYLDSEAGRRDLEYWRARLAGAPGLDLATDRPRPATQSFRGGAHPFRLDADLCERLRALARAEGTTLYTVALAAFQVLLHRYTGRDDIVVGSPVAGRTQADLADVVGYLVNPLLLRADLAGSPSFRDVLQQARRAVLDALDHQRVPFPVLVEQVRLPREPGRPPLFQAMLAFQQAPAPELGGIGALALGAGGGRLQLGGLDLESVALPTRTAQVEITLALAESENGLLGAVQYNADLFEPATATRLADSLATLLAAIVSDPGASIADLPILPAAERQCLVQTWSGPAVEYPGPAALHELVEAQVARSPNAVATTFMGTDLTYAALNRRANRLAHRLRALGVGPDTLVAICAERSHEMVIGLLAILKAGGAYVPLDPEYPRERLAVMLRDARAPVLLTQRGLLDTLPDHAAETLLLDDASAVAGMPEHNPTSGATGHHLAYVIFTSGSTGQPKGAMNAHRGIRNRLLWMQETYRLDASDCVLQKTPFSFDVSVWEFFWPLMTGARLVLARPGGHRDPDYLVRLIQSEGVTTLHFVPSMLQAFLDEPDLSGCRSLRRVICSGEALPRALQDRFFARLAAELHNLYGPTEAAVDVSAWACDPRDASASVPIGRPIANTQLSVLDGHLRPVPIGVVGELCIGGVQVGLGYLGRPGLTAERFSPDPFATVPDARLYRTGDLARYRSDGVIEILGRLDHQVKIRGFRIELGEIEAAMLALLSVREACVLARDDGDGPRLVAYVVPDGSSTPSIEALRARLTERLPQYMIPSVWVILDAMPLSPNGKLDRRALPAPSASTTAPAAVSVPPRDDLERALVAIWQDVLKTGPIGIRDSFFDVGGHSLSALRVVAQIEERGWRRLPVATLLRAPTIEALAAVLRGEDAAPEAPCLLPIQPTGTRVPFFCASASYGDAVALAGLARQLGADQPLYALQPPGDDHGAAAWQSVPALAATYVAAIRRVQPSGPYLLGGFSIGGVIIYEAARQLRAQGQEVGLVALLDTMYPLRSHDVYAGYRLLRALFERTPLGSLQMATRRLREIFSDPALAAQLRAVRAYRPGPYDGAVVLLRAASGVSVATLTAGYWRRVLRGGLTIKSVPGRHDTMLREPHLRQTARCLGHILDAALPVTSRRDPPSAYDRTVTVSPRASVSRTR